MDTAHFTFLFKQKAIELGFDQVGSSRADFLEEEADRLEKWLKQGFQGEMQYMNNHVDLRLDPRKFFDGAKTIVSLTYNYYSDTEQLDADAPKISKYAYGQDYHQVIKEKLKALLAFVQVQMGDVYGRCFVDSAPIMERVWAKKAGLGWIGKNTLLLTKNKGSFYFLAELVLDLELVYDGVLTKDYCGTCTKCIDACPTEAIVAPYQVDGSKCISYFTIELKDQIIPSEMKSKFQNWAFGCDICQDVCPINARSKPHEEPAFMPSEAFLNLTKKEWIEMTDEVFENLFKNSPIQRTKLVGMKRNISSLTP